MPTVPTAPEAVALASIATYLQAKKNAGQTITGQPYVVKETGQPFAVALVGSTYYALGEEFTLPIQMNPVALSATGTFAYFPVPPDKSILLTTLNILSNTTTTLDGTHYWTFGSTSKIAADGLDTPVTVNNSAGTADSDLALTITTFSTNPLPVGSYYVALNATKTSTPGNVTINAVLRGRIVFATLT